MRLEARPDLTAQQQVALFDAASPDVRAELAAGAKSITVESDGDGTVVIRSDRLDEPKIVSVKEGT